MVNGLQYLRPSTVINIISWLKITLSNTKFMYFHVPACYLKPTYTKATVLPVLHLQTSANVILRRGAKSGEILWQIQLHPGSPSGHRFL